MRNQILKELKSIEDMHNCSILFACESGSRAWGFASMDSDYDVRFIYVNSIDWYLGIDTHADAISAILPNDIDLSGWELKKALTLFLKSNICLFEWLDSPEVYQKDEQFYLNLRDLIPKYFNPKIAIHHYFSTANKMMDMHLHTTEVNIKKLFYIIRPIFACKWIILNNSMPPTIFDRLYTNLMIPEFMSDYINHLLAKKSQASEKDKIQIPNQIFDWINHTMKQINDQIGTIEAIKNNSTESLNKIMLKAIHP